MLCACRYHAGVSILTKTLDELMHVWTRDQNAFLNEFQTLRVRGKRNVITLIW